MQFDWKMVTSELNQLLKLTLTPIGMKGFKDREDMKQVAKLRRPKHIFTPCQVIGQSIQLGQTIGFTAEDIATLNCNATCGLKPQDKKWREQSVEFFENVWWEKEEDVLKHCDSLTPIEQPIYDGFVVSPLRSGKIEPDICIITAEPGSIFMLLSGYLRSDYQPLDIKLIGESSCSQTWVKTIYTGEIGLALPCFAEMRYAGFPSSMMLLTLKPDALIKAIEGMHQLSKVGLRYPVPSYSVQVDVREGLGVSYNI